MSSSSDSKPDRLSVPGPAATSAVRPANSPRSEASEDPSKDEAEVGIGGHTLPGGMQADSADLTVPVEVMPTEHSSETELDDLTAAAKKRPSGSKELQLTTGDIERVTLVELPALARYGNYELLGRIAYGGMAEIFLAREVGSHGSKRMMVVKRVLPHVAEDEHFVDMFVDEARLAMQLNHPSICHVYSFGETEGTAYIAMEWVNGKPLSKIVRRARKQGGMPIPIALKIVAQVAEALDYAHRAADAAGEPLGVVHRDVSPQNIMVSYDGVVKLLDFGIAKATSHSTRTEAGVIKGKFAYMSPQQCVGEPIDSRADIFALGICLFEALTGKNPFRRKTEFETMTKIVGDPTPRARDRRAEVPEQVDAILETALMKQPEARYQTAGDLQVALEQVIAVTGTVVNASRIGDYVSTLFAEDVRDGPELDTRLTMPPANTTGTFSADDSIDASPRRAAPVGATELEQDAILTTEPEKKKRGLGPIAVLLLIGCLVAVAAVGGGLAWGLFHTDAGGDVLAGAGLGGEPTPSPPPDIDPLPEPPPFVPPADPEVGAQNPGAATTGSVFIESVPSGASIRFGDRASAGTAPLSIGMVEPGTYEVGLHLEGHRDWNGQVVVVAGERASLRRELSAEEPVASPTPTGRVGRRRAPPREPRPAAGPPGELSLNTRPWSRVFLGSRLLGTTPLGRVPIPSGRQRLRLVDRDGNEHTRTINVPEAGSVTEFWDLSE